jgi:hypothetical protein
MILAGATMLLAACGACSSSKGDTAAGGDGGGSADVVVETGPSAADACLAFATAFCNRLEACTPFALQVSYGDANSCAQRGVLLCVPALSANGSTITPTQMETCAQAVEQETCDEALDNPQPSACDVPGTLAVGAVCGSHAQCQTNYCKLTPGTLCGTCTAHSGNGAQCQLDSDCAATLICNGGTCVGPAQSGAACGSTQPCMRSLVCIGNKCQTPLGSGAACTGTTPTTGVSDCDAAHGLYCNTQTKKCAQTQIAPTGQPCGIVSGNLVACANGDSCGNVSNGQGTCHQPAGDGAVCGPDIACVAPAVCTSTARCTLPNPSVCH